MEIKFLFIWNWMSLKMNEDKDKVDDNEKKKAKTNERQYIFFCCVYQNVITQCHFSISAYYLKCDCWNDCLKPFR